MDTTIPAPFSLAWPTADDDAAPTVGIIAARVLREPQICYPLGDGPEYIAADIAVDIELFDVPLPQLVVTVFSSNVLFCRRICQSTWPWLDWFWAGEGSEFLAALRTRSGDYVIELEDLREAVLDAAQWHPLVRTACRSVGRMIDDVLERRRLDEFPRVHPAVHDELTTEHGPDPYLRLPAGTEGDAGRE